MNRDNIYRKIAEVFDRFKSVVEHKTEKTSRGWRTPPIKLAITEPPTLFSSKSTDPARSGHTIINLEPLEWVGKDEELFNARLYEKLFFAIADALSPQGIVFLVYRKGPEVDGVEGPEANYKHFKGLGKALEYAQELIQEHFRDKDRKIPFPEVEYLLSSRTFDQGPYASSITLQPIKLG